MRKYARLHYWEDKEVKEKLKRMSLKRKLKNKNISMGSLIREATAEFVKNK